MLLKKLNKTENVAALDISNDSCAKSGQLPAGSSPGSMTWNPQGSLKSPLPGFRLSPRLPTKSPRALE